MVPKIMTEEEIIISKIKNLRYIKIFDLFNNSWNNKAVAAVLINYINEKGRLSSICYCEKDKLFDVFVDKIMERYNLEKNDNKINYGNQLTKEIIENNYEFAQTIPSEKYISKKGVDNPILNYEKDEFLKFKNIITYFINQISTFFGLNIKLNDKIYGNRSNYSIVCEINGRERIIPLNYKKISENNYEIVLNNLIGNLNFIKLNINYKIDKVEINWSVLSLNLEYKSIYYFDTNIFKEELVSSGKTLYHNNSVNKNVTETLNNDLIEETSEINKPLNVLPWKDLYTYDKTYISQDNSDIFIERTTYIYDMLDRLSIDIRYEKTYNNKNSIIRLNGMHEKINIYKVIDDKNIIYLFERYFSKVSHSLGKYKNHLENKSFYECILEDKTFDIDPSKIGHKAQLHDAKSLKLIMKGNNNNGNI